MGRKRKRVIIDTNLLVSFLINRDFARLDFLLYHSEIVIVSSVELVAELIKVVDRPKLKKYFPPGLLTELLQRLARETETVDVVSQVLFSPDPDDNFLLSLAKDGRADFLITGDKKLLSLRTFGKTKLVNMTEFLFLLT